MLNRRRFLSAVSLSAAAIAVDPEMLGWTKLKSIFIPAPPKILKVEMFGQFHIGDLLTFAGKYAMDPVTHKPTNHLQYFTVTAITENGVDMKPVPLF